MNLSKYLGVGIKILRANLSSRAQIPLSVYLSVTDRCPHGCEYCNIPNRRLKEMSTEEILSLIGQVKRNGAERLQIVGGEPLIRRDIGEIVNFAKDNGLYVTASSTGFFPEKIEAIRNIDMMFLSFDGQEDIHDFHKGKGAYSKLRETMTKLRELKVNFWTTTVLTKMNKDAIDFILRTARQNNFMTVFQPIYYTLIDYKDHFHLPNIPDKFVLGNEKIHDVFSRLIMEKKRGAPIASSLPYLEYMLNWKDYGRIYSPHKDEHVKCWAGRLYCYIDTNGLLYPRGDSIGVVEGRDCLRDSFEEAFRKIQEPEPGVCGIFSTALFFVFCSKKNLAFG